MIGYIIGFISLGLTALVGLWGLYMSFSSWFKKDKGFWSYYKTSGIKYWFKK